MKKTIIILSFTIFFGINKIMSEVRIPEILSDNMVLQREIPVNIWGWANPGEKVILIFNNQKLTTKTGNDGKWKVQLKPMQAGGPFEMDISGKNEILLKNILIGDVWICSGQSNMEFTLNRANNSFEEISSANYPSIRFFKVSHFISEKPLENIDPGKWEICSPSTAENFSAVAYFFGKNLYNHSNVPMGLINASFGGTNIESWSTMESLYGFNEYKPDIEKLKTKNFSQQNQNINELKNTWEKKVESDDSGRIQKWQQQETNYSLWKEMKLPQFWEKAGLPDVDGIVWFKTEFELSPDEAKKDIHLHLGIIDDADETYLNGKLVGHTYDYMAVRNYAVSSQDIKTGKNILVVRVLDNGWNGGFGSKEKDFYIDAGGMQKSLSGNWKYKIGISQPSPFLIFNPNFYPSSLFNGMISPLTNLAIKGVIWYQGESNTGNAVKYRTLLSDMITDWRKSWQQGNFPFLVVQLPNYNPDDTSDHYNWALLRESQTLAISNLPNTGLAVTIDVGEANNIHPKNKQDVGYRLSLVARKIAYNEDIVSSGPVFKSMKIDDNKAIIEFDNIGTGFFVKDKYQYIRGFSIAGSDKIFHWAKAYLEGNKIIVMSNEVNNPIAVRYAWSNNPDDGNLYNKELLPAAPFRTDQW